MKTHLVLGMTALMTIASAIAAAPVIAAPADPAPASAVDRDRLKLVEFNFTCEFDRQRRDADFRAFAQVFAWVDPDDWMTTMSPAQRDRVRNKLAVLREDELIYADGAILEPKHRVVIIRAIQGEPEIVIERKDHMRLDMPNHGFEAFLKIHGRKIRGECKVRNEIVHD
jgi:hypothetical protein